MRIPPVLISIRAGGILLLQISTIYAIISLGLPSNGRRLALLAEGDQKPSVDIEICIAEIEAKEGDRI